jgi:phage gp29-like protein
MKPDRMAAVIRRAEQGQLEDWADLCSFMLRTDAHLAGVYETRLFAVTAAEIKVTPGKARPGQEAVAERAADAFREELEKCRGLESIIHGLCHAEGVGYAVAYHDWQRQIGADGIAVTRSTPKIVAPRDIDFDVDWTARVRSWDPKRGPQWMRTADQPAAFLVHVPQKLDTPNMSGDLMSVAWLWLFKRWAHVFMQIGLERFASPLVYGQVPVNAVQTVRDTLLSALENMTQAQAAVLEAGTELRTLEAGKAPDEAWTRSMRYYDAEITKRLLGSTDAVEADKGSYARAEVQGQTTVVPRFHTIGKRLAGTFERDWATPFTKFNAHLWGGVTAPVPSLSFKFVQDERPEVTELAVKVGAVTMDEVRRANGLEEWGSDAGAKIAEMPEAAPAASGQMFSAPRTAKEAAAPTVDVPLLRSAEMARAMWRARQRSIELSTSRTFDGSRLTTSRVPFEK